MGIMEKYSDVYYGGIVMCIMRKYRDVYYGEV